MTARSMHPKRSHIHRPTKLLDKATDSLTWFVGSWLFLSVSALWFGLWILLHVEPFPFGLLTMIVSLEAIFLSTLVMMSQNRQAIKDRVRDDTEAREVEELYGINQQELKILQRQQSLELRLDHMEQKLTLILKSLEQSRSRIVKTGTKAAKRESITQEIQAIVMPKAEAV